MVNLSPYRVSEVRREAIDSLVEKMLELEVIEEACSPWSKSIVMVPKPNPTLRFCNDFRRLNAVSEFKTYSMPW